ncbi:CaiB/BaiF CoA-transferase family protein [Aneurinibacillus sp. Ricciae_BoGa-3]|uniref:CaiB/BaiF CoA transferase family protein n=1 Tax=Aneurinibacillus sp. Ricciae_BoGa-3 TaxID=3022697 RepID=UPI0023422556|nr:CaiB/BaiF CoA-transferase family protein [Aneurinibacillus sp. Ricciae_BoGa-3]WCK56357.1 CaiB/BaiF CoA-transferase family protein [Aneurinibacillus sp. Ricciae_BoGa-3]
MKKALDGITILDFSRVIAGPFFTMLLGDFGAEVIKVELPGGSDDTRGWIPPDINGESAYYLCANRNKKSLTVDLKTEEGKTIIKELAKKADVVVENFKTGTMKKFGLDYDSLKETNPRLIYCSITGFGQTGPYASHPGYDYIVQAMSGLMSITGPKDGDPYKVGVAISDIMASLYAGMSVLIALQARKHTGKGQAIDISLLDCTIASLINITSNYLATNNPPQRLGNDHPNVVPYQTFKASDDYLVIAVGNNLQFKRLAQSIGRMELAIDPKFETNEMRLRNREALTEILSFEIQRKTVHEWLEIFNSNQIPCSPINTIDKVFKDPHVTERGLLKKMNHPQLGEFAYVNNPIRLSDTPAGVYAHPPMLSEQTNEILINLGYTIEQIKQLKEKNIV